jgi:tetratricopeptide (TPR) repeat protein
MKLQRISRRALAGVVLAVLATAVASGASAAQRGAPAPQRNAASSQPAPAQAQSSASDPTAEAYDEFLLAQRYEDDDNFDAATAAYKRAISLDPKSGDLISALANLYMRANRSNDAISTAEDALKIDPANHEAHRILGTIYATMATSDARGSQTSQRQNIDKAIQHLEQAIENPVGEPDANVRAMLARLYLATRNYDKAIPLLSELVKQEPQWQDGVSLLAAAYSDAGRPEDAIRWLEGMVEEDPQLYPTLADFYGQQRRWKDAARAYERAVQASPRSFDLRVRYAQALLSAGGPDNAVKAQGVLREALQNRANDERAMYLLSQAERIAGDLDQAEATARQLIGVNAKSARAYVALAEALEERQRYQAVADALAPAVMQFGSGQSAAMSLAMLLPHLGFAYQQLGQSDKAIATFEEARKVSPDDQSLTTYLIQAQIAGKKYAAAEELARQARTAHPNDLRLARLEAQALRQSGKVDQGLAVLMEFAQKPTADSTSYIAVAQYCADANRGAQAIKVLQDAQAKFPADTVITFELAAQLDKQKRFAESEATFRQLLAKEPENAPALNYLGYVLAERGEKLDESVQFVQRALKVEPDNGSYLDSLGWAYYKSGKLDLALDNLGRAADHLTANSVIQDHYGDVLFKAGRIEEAIGAWNRALSGDGDSIDRGEVEKKIKSARQKLPKK